MGGVYKIKVESVREFTEVFRKFRIHSFSENELIVTVDFGKENYSAGDTISAKVKVRKPDGEGLIRDPVPAVEINT